jgi:hypothetical protein
MLYLEILPNELMEILFIKLKKDSVLVSNISDTLKKLYNKFMYNINNGIYLPINYLKRVSDINKVKNTLIHRITTYHFIDIDDTRLKYIIDTIKSIKYIYSSYIYDNHINVLIAIVAQTVDNNYIFIRYMPGTAGICVYIDNYKNWKLFWDEILIKENITKDLLLIDNQYVDHVVILPLRTSLTWPNE